eukprot:scaffold29647_cov72-Phaeocystis_antarctica.AAC.1
MSRAKAFNLTPATSRVHARASRDSRRCCRSCSSTCSTMRSSTTLTPPRGAKEMLLRNIL